MVDLPYTPPVFTGPGSQPADHDGGELAYMAMPEGMRVFSAAHVPEADSARATPHGLAAARAILAALRAGLPAVGQPGGQAVIDLSALDSANLAFVDQLLGEGEVSVVAGAEGQAQEAVLAGVWRIRLTDPDGRRRADLVEVGAFPQTLLAGAFAGAAPRVAPPARVRDHVFNAPPLLAEINAALEGQLPLPHTINLSLLPHTEDDLGFLDDALGRGQLIVLSRGYGNCRIQATATHQCWWVRYFNSQDTLILNSLEISPIPAVALAAPEDLEDSAERLAEILEIYA